MSVHTNEREFHDALAATLRKEGIALRGADHLEAAVLKGLEDLEGKTVLDLGCGAGDFTLLLAERGAKVTALDISSGMVELARERIAEVAPDATIEFVVAPAEDTGLPAESFDLVIGKWILHHIDVGTAANEIARVLRPGGHGIFIENSSTNPVLSFARAKLAGRFGIPRYGTADEHPLGDEEYGILAPRFARLSLNYPDFFFFRLFNRQVLRHRSRSLSRFFEWLDDELWRRFSSLRRYSYHVILELEKASP